MDTTTLNVSNIRVINIPSDVDVEVMTNRVSDVVLYGPADELANLRPTACSPRSTARAFGHGRAADAAVSIQIPSSGHIFAVGNYSVQCQVTTR